MTNIELKEKNIQELLNNANDDTILIPPCCNDDVLNLFSKFFHLWKPANEGNFSDYMNKEYSTLTAKDIIKLEKYLVDANKYLLNICCVFAGIYQSYGGVGYCYGEDQKYCDILIRTCLRRYPWLTEKYINENLWQICRLCNW